MVCVYSKYKTKHSKIKHRKSCVTCTLYKRKILDSIHTPKSERNMTNNTCTRDHNSNEVNQSAHSTLPNYCMYINKSSTITLKQFGVSWIHAR